MSRGYFVVKPVVFHNQESKDNFLAKNPDYIHIGRKDIMQLFKRYENKDIQCESCVSIHTVGKIQWSKFE